ncbi:YlbE-like family protein [Aliibacillus thermotolerans]|uniref:YlbE-like family protein n=1 Tax=Aliibacillus thermotolerans TaxID=1834418 RepID=A0ABW0U4Z0_9BACI|nr:YlbE-like family protein [Aliibacillus thermotolerans]MDA3131037.1 hypothetical protein [Aliibacillus thermotolerans]
MPPELFHFLSSKREFHTFIRWHPEWYRTLNKHPEKMEEFVYAAQYFHGQTLPQRLKRWQNNLNMALLLLSLFKQR